MSQAVLESVRRLWRHVGLDESFLQYLTLYGDPDLAIQSSFKVGHLAQATTSLAGLSASAFHSTRSKDVGKLKVSVDARHAVLCFASELYTLIDGEVPKDVWDDLAGPYATRDGYVRIQTNFPHHRQGILSLLQSVGTRSAVSEALLKENAVDFETRATTAGMCVSAIRSFGQWDRHPHAQTLVGRLPIELIKIGDASPRKFEPSSKPLGGVKVLELTRIMAGPVAGRTLAHFGADVLWITSPNLPSLPVIDIDTSRGKRAAQLDLNEARDVDKLRELLEGADVFLQSYRPGSLESRGFGPAELASLKGGRGIIVANLRGYGWEGPWANKRAFDSLVQAATGFNVAEGEAWATAKGESISNTPLRTLPVQALDHGAGQLLAFGIIAALCKSITEGGSWEVRVSLAGVAQWLRELGRIPMETAFSGQPLEPRKAPMAEEIRKWSREWAVRSPKSNPDAGAGPSKLLALSSAVEMSGVPLDEVYETPGSLDCDELAWL